MRIAPHRTESRVHQTGVGLIEVLVALLILAIGLLGIAGLQTAAVQTNYLAYQYTMAARLAENLAENMRANRVGLLNNDYTLAFGAEPADPGSDCGAASADCSPAELAAWQLADWYGMLASPEEAYENSAVSLAEALPSARGSVTCAAPCTDRSLRVITVYWDAERTGVSGDGCDPDDPDDLQCLRLGVNP